MTTYSKKSAISKTIIIFALSTSAWTRMCVITYLAWRSCQMKLKLSNYLGRWCKPWQNVMKNLLFIVTSSQITSFWNPKRTTQMVSNIHKSSWQTLEYRANMMSMTCQQSNVVRGNMLLLRSLVNHIMTWKLIATALE